MPTGSRNGGLSPLKGEGTESGGSQNDRFLTRLLGALGCGWVSFLMLGWALELANWSTAGPTKYYGTFSAIATFTWACLFFAQVAALAFGRRGPLSPGEYR